LAGLGRVVDHLSFSFSFLGLQSADFNETTVILLLLTLDCGALHREANLSVKQNLAAVRVRQDAKRSKYQRDEATGVPHRAYLRANR